MNVHCQGAKVCIGYSEIGAIGAAWVWIDLRYAHRTVIVRAYRYPGSLIGTQDRRRNYTIWLAGDERSYELAYTWGGR